jgi:hypothetical protein
VKTSANANYVAVPGYTGVNTSTGLTLGTSSFGNIPQTSVASGEVTNAFYVKNGSTVLSGITTVSGSAISH